jgi:transposase
MTPAQERDPKGEKSKLTDAEMIECHGRGMSVAEIAAAADLSLTWVYRRLKRAGADVRRPEPKPCPVPIEQLAEEYAAGASILTLAERHGLYFKRVRQLLLGHGVTLRPSTKAGRDART